MSKAEALARLLLDARDSGQRIDRLPPELVPANPAEAYAVQAAVAPELGLIAGWKVGAPRPTAEPNCAPLFAALMAPSPARFPARSFPLGGIEGELAFRLARPLPPRKRDYPEAEVWAAVASVHPAIELVDSRFADFRGVDKLALLADNQGNGAFCYGAAFKEWRLVDFEKQPAKLEIDGKEVASAIGGNAAGHPKRLLGWLANHCARLGRGLREGDIVTTGSHTGLVFATPGAAATVRFAGIGDASLTLVA
jgi:2-keto-4-pentenoate hydratase